MKGKKIPQKLKSICYSDLKAFRRSFDEFLNRLQGIEEERSDENKVKSIVGDITHKVLAGEASTSKVRKLVLKALEEEQLSFDNSATQGIEKTIIQNVKTGKALKKQQEVDTEGSTKQKNENKFYWLEPLTNCKLVAKPDSWRWIKDPKTGKEALEISENKTGEPRNCDRFQLMFAAIVLSKHLNYSGPVYLSIRYTKCDQTISKWCNQFRLAEELENIIQYIHAINDMLERKHAELQAAAEQTCDTSIESVDSDKTLQESIVLADETNLLVAEVA